MEHKEYNGWTNYETWVVSLWMDNEQSTYDFFREQARHWTDVDRFADCLKEYHEELLPKLKGFAADLMNAAMSEVNWFEIASHLKADIKENA